MKINYELKYVNGDATNTHLAGSQPIDQSINVKHITELIWLARDRSMLSIGYVIAKQQRIILLAFTVLSFLYNLHTLFISFYSSYIYFIYVDNITKTTEEKNSLRAWWFIRKTTSKEQQSTSLWSWWDIQLEVNLSKTSCKHLVNILLTSCKH